MTVAETLYAVLGFWKVMLNGALDRVRAMMVPALIKQVKQLEIADVVSDLYSVRDIKIPEFDIAHSEIRVEDGSIVKIVLSGIDLRVTLNWGYKVEALVAKVEENGTADISTKDASFMLTARIGFDLATYTPTVTVVDADFDVGKLVIDLNGGVSGLLVGLLTTFFRSEIVNLINAQVRVRLASTIETILREELNKRQKLFRNIFFGLIAFVLFLFLLILYFKFFAGSSTPPLDTANSTDQGEVPSTEPSADK